MECGLNCKMKYINEWIEEDGGEVTRHGTFAQDTIYQGEPVRTKKILSLFDHTGAWSKPYADAGYQVFTLDIQGGANRFGAFDLCDFESCADLFEFLDDYDMHAVDGILAAVPCTDFSASGARWWKGKDATGDTAHSVSLARLTLEIIETLRPAWWAIENPVGRLPKLVPELKPFGPVYFQPYEFGDPYTKKTGLWGEFNTNLTKNPVEPTEGSKMWKIPPGPERANLRSATPQGFAESFFKANQ